MKNKVYWTILIILSIMRAYKATGKPVPKRDIVTALGGIGKDYVEQLLVPVRCAKLLTSVRGLRGGFVPREEPITAWDVFNAVDDSNALLSQAELEPALLELDNELEASRKIILENLCLNELV